MKSRPGDIFRNINRNVGVGRFTKDTYVKQHVPPPPIQEEVQEEIIEEIKQEENESIRRNEVEQAEIPSGSQSPRKHSGSSSKRNQQSN
jgi:hypothetical protein